MLVTCLLESGRLQTNDFGEGQVSVRLVSTERRQVNAAMKLCTWPDQRKRNFLQNIWMLIGCLSAMLSFGTCNGNRGGFTVCAVKNNLGILVVVFIPKRTRFELPFLCCGGHFRKQMYSICMCFQDYYYAGYVVCFVSVYTISCCLPCRVSILLFLSLIYFPLFYCHVITKVRGWKMLTS